MLCPMVLACKRSIQREHLFRLHWAFSECPVGSVVGQIARIKGAYAVGIAGGSEKCRYVTEELGFDACIDHRTSDRPHKTVTQAVASISM